MRRRTRELEPHDRKPRERSGEKGNPAMYRGAVVAVLGALASLGVGWAADVDRDTVTGIAVGLSLLLPLIQGWWTRRAVVPEAATLAYVDDDGRTVAGEAAAESTGAPLPVVPGPDGAYVVTRVTG